MAERDGLDWFSLLQLVLSAAGAVLLGMLSAGGLLLVSLSRLSPPGNLPVGQLDSLMILLAGMGFAGLLLVPSAVFAAQRLLGFEIPGTSPLPGAQWLIAFILPLLAAGYAASQNLSWGAAVLPVIHVLINGSLIFWLVSQAKLGLPEGSRQRFWGTFGSGLVGSPLLALIVEMILLLGVVLLWGFYLQTKPGQYQELLSLVERVSRSSFTPEMADQLIGEYLFRPGVLWSLILFIAVLIPVVEEVIKPLGVWLLLGRDLEPKEGFVLGAVSGAGYALFENLTLAADAQGWFVVVVSRFGTTAVHILTSGLVGWGLVVGLKKGRLGKLAYAYGAAVLLHGVWNGLNVLLALGTAAGAEQALGTFWIQVSGFSWVGLVLLGVGSLVGLFQAENLLKRAIMGRVQTTEGN